MGVDLMINGVSLASVPVAHCRPFRPGVTNPVLFTNFSQGEKEVIIRRIFPLESIPITFTTPDGLPVSAEVITDERFAVDVTLKYFANLEQEYTFNAWVSREEYESLKQQYHRKRDKLEDEDNYLPSLRISVREWQHICGSCPLSFPLVIDCGPRMFDYGSLPLLRRAAGELMSGPNRAEFAHLVKAIDLIFPVKSKGGGSQAGKQDKAFQAFHAMMTKQMPKEVKATPQYIPESPPDTRADHLIDQLFFWDGKRVGWVGGQKLHALRVWFDEFIPLLKQTAAVTGPSEEMKVMLGVMSNYYPAVRQCDDYDIKIRMSW